jgi:hypothetical protein
VNFIRKLFGVGNKDKVVARTSVSGIPSTSAPLKADQIRSSSFSSTSISARRFITPLEATIIYRDSNGDKTKRRVRLEVVGAWGNDYMVWGYCYLRNAAREFRLSNIITLYDADGHAVSDFVQHLTKERPATDTRHTKSIIVSR